MRVIEGIEALGALVGSELGASNWFTVDQDRIQAFADVTGDQQWIHVDVERARRESPLGGPVAHGYLILSLLPMLSGQIFQVTGIKTRINYGLNRVRFPAPTPSGARLRARIRLKSVEPAGEGRFKVCLEATVELEGQERPAGVAEMLSLYVL